MTQLELARRWAELVESQKCCQLCATGCARPLIHAAARPLFGKFRAWDKGVLFIFEAPNRDDTFDENKGYLTYDCETDPTGRFTRQLMVEELALNPDYFQVTNSVLCLPMRNGGKFTISGRQRALCSSLIREQIRVLNPSVVVPVGLAALQATKLLDPHPYRKMLDAVARPVPWSKRWLFPLFHTSMLARNARGGRTAAEQRRDWRSLREFIASIGVVIPA